MPEVGRTIGRYEVLRQIGRGGMAVVYLARQPELERFVALKELRALHDDDPSHAHRFLREARLAGSLTDPNVVTVYDYFEHDGTPYLAMEYLERGSLRPFVGQMNLPQIAGVLEGMLSGLTAAERQDIVHRDLKPENVLVTADGRVKLADFGIAKATTALQTGSFQTATGMTVGTPAYIAPEQAMSEEIGPWTDLYSVGCVAFELFTGKTPFHDVDTPVAVLMRHVTHPVPPATSLVPDLDPRLSEWVARLTLKDAQERTRSAAEAWEALEEIVLDVLGPRWRRDARLQAPAGDAEPEYRTYTEGEPPAVTAQPYTPPPPDLPPGPLAPPPAETPPPAATPPVAEATPSAVTPPSADAPPPPDVPAGPLVPPPEPAESPRRSRRGLLIGGAVVLVLVAVVAGVLATSGDDPEQAAAPSRTDVMPPDNVMSNPSFEQNMDGWGPFQATLAREAADDAPDGEYVARVTLDGEPEEYSIDDDPDVLERGTKANTEYVAGAWVKATPETDGRPVCIAIRDWTVGRPPDTYTGPAEGSVIASAGEYRKVEVRYVAPQDGNTIDVHVYRYPGEMEPNEAFLVDAITVTEHTPQGSNTQLVDDATCGA
jgi:serine/threonine protein kinase